MNNYIITIIGLIYRVLSKNIFVIATHTSITKGLGLKTKKSFGRY